MNMTPLTIIPKKRGRKSKKPVDDAPEVENVVVQIEDLESASDNEPDAKIVPKKRGRKPKGGKIIHQSAPQDVAKEPKPNVILHLKCSLKDLQSTNVFGSSLEGFSFSVPTTHVLSYNNVISETQPPEFLQMSAVETNHDLDAEYGENEDGNGETDIREIWKKLKMLEHNLHVNNVDNKKSACFWDTCEFDNPPVYIPKHYMNDTYHVYGCFCSPECAVAHLMEENIDSSVKFERYQLINHIYSKIYNYSKNVKPAPNPYYMLERYYGNLTIQEYRALLRNERLFLVVDKPLTRVMPELHEDNDDFIMNNKIIPTNNIKLRKTNKKPTKTNILSERFGLVQT
ncbi:MAG: hypothetical protein ACOVRN_01760 [Flavobacterium sp.]